MDMVLINFNTLLDCLQSPHSLPNEMMTSQEGLHFRDIHFAPPLHTLNMQHVSLMYLKSLISDNCFQPEGTPSDAASGFTAILIVFLSDEQHAAIQHIHIGLVVHRIGCNLYDQDGILPFIKSIGGVMIKSSCTFSSYTTSKLDIFGHYCDLFCVDCTQISIFKKVN